MECIPKAADDFRDDADVVCADNCADVVCADNCANVDCADNCADDCADVCGSVRERPTIGVPLTATG